MTEKKQIFNFDECAGKTIAKVSETYEDGTAILFTDNTYIVFTAYADDGYRGRATTEIEHERLDYNVYYKK